MAPLCTQTSLQQLYDLSCDDLGFLSLVWRLDELHCSFSERFVLAQPARSGFFQASSHLVRGGDDPPTAAETERKLLLFRPEIGLELCEEPKIRAIEVEDALPAVSEKHQI